jgi:hypothetical protein
MEAVPQRRGLFRFRGNALSSTLPEANQSIAQAAAALETRRIAAVERRARFRTIGAVIGLMLILVFLMFAQSTLIAKLFAVVFGLLAGGLVGYGVGSGHVRNVEQDARSQLVGAIAARHGLSFAVADFEPFHLASFRAMGLLPSSWDRASFCDLLRGMHDGRPFISWGLHCEEQREETSTNSKGETTSRTKWVTLFRGRVYAIDWKQKFLGRTYISRRGWFNFAPSGTYEITPSDPRFVDDFAIFTTDGTEGHFLVDPLMIERLIDVEAANEASRLRGAFIDRRLLLVMNGPDQLINLDMGKALDSTDALDLIDQKVTKAFALVDQVS